MNASAAKELVDIHLKTWSERDAAKRLQLLAEAYTPDASLNDPTKITVGLTEISDVIAHLHSTTVGFTFRLVGAVNVQHDAIRLSWEYGPPDDPAAITGQDFMLLRGAKVAAVYAFIDAPAKP